MTTHNLYIGTAQYYAQYRVPYPSELFDELRRESKPTGEGRLLDLGCGTGEIALPLHTYFRDVWAVDREQEMIEVGREKGRENKAGNVRWLVCRAEDVEAPAGAFELITVGAAFHWMDRPLIARRACDWLPAGRCLAVLGSNSPWTGQAEWQTLALDVIRRWLGEERRAGSGTFSRPEQPHEEVLRSAGFDVESHDFWTPHIWMLDSFMGYLFSTSFASKAVLGEAAAPFEADMRSTLLTYDPSGRYHEDINFYYILGRKGEDHVTGE